MGGSFDFLVGGGEMGERMRAMAWAGTPLGRPEEWPESLRSALGICLGSRFPIAIYWGERLTLLYNDAWSPIAGGKHPWALARDAREVWPEIWDTIGPLFEQVMRNGESTYSEDSLLPMRRHGYTEECYFNFTFTPIRGASGRIEGVFNAVIETTYRVIAERRARALRELGERLAAAQSTEDAARLAAASLGAAKADAAFCAVYLGQADEARLAACEGVAQERLRPGTWPFAEAAARGEVLEVPDLGALVAPIFAGAATEVAGFLVVGASPRRAVDDEYRVFVERAASHIGKALSTTAALEAERRRAEALAELDRAKTAFFSNVSHEFRTPLTLMLGPVDDLLAKGEAGLAPADREALQVVQRNGQRLLKLVNTLLDFARIEAGRVQASYEPVELGALCAELASNFRSACERAGLRLVVDCPAPGEPAYVDREMWEKIVLNLLSNAFKFTLQGEIAVRLRESASAFALAVSDTGAGIPAQELPRMFERFHRVEGARGRSHEGSGIGLALVQELVRLHRGTIAVESELGRGATFTVTIPKGSAHLPAERLSAPRAAPSSAPRAAAASALRADAYVGEALGWLPGEPREAFDPPRDRRVLLADDNADLREYARRLLAEHYAVEAVGDGAAALEAARRRAPDLVISDVMMPGLDGFGLLRELRRDERLRRVPVILLSARAGEEARVEGLESGADDYVVKPFSARELLVRVESLLRTAELRQQAGREIRESEERLRLALESGKMGTWEWHIAENRVFWSPALQELHGLVPGSFDGTFEAYQRDIHPDDRESVLDNVRRTFEHGEDHRVEYRIVRPDASLRWVEGRGKLVRDAEGRPLRMIGVCADITARKAAEEILRRRAGQQQAIARVGELALRERSLQSVLDYATAAIAETLHVEYCKVLELQPGGGALLLRAGVGWRAGLVGSALVDAGRDSQAGFTLLCDAPVIVSELARESRFDGPPLLLEHAVVSGMSCVIRGADGTAWGVLGAHTTRLVSFTDDDVAFLVAVANILSDAIHRDRVEQALREADRRKDEFLATLSHELRNPLAPLRNALQLLELSAPGDGRIEPLRELMERQVDHLVRLVDDLLEMSRISRGAFELRREPVAVSEVVRNALETSQPLLKAARHELSVAVPREPLWVDGDRVRLAQILANLLNNAAKYTDPGGRVAIAARKRDGAVEIAVRDNGPGIAAEVLPRLFEMFARGGGPDRAGQGGLGIGLALARRLAEMHGGSLGAKSEGPGRGTEFTLTLPLAAAPSAVAAASAPARGHLAPRRILVVDDNRDAAHSLSMVLKFLGADVQVAHDGGQALEAFRSYEPGVVFLDIGMPGMDGYEVARRMRASHGEPRPALIALTGWGQAADRQRARDAGFDHHLVKPADLGALQVLLASLEAPSLSRAS